MMDRFADIADFLIDQKIDFHIAKEYPMSRSSLVSKIDVKKQSKDEL